MKLSFKSSLFFVLLSGWVAAAVMDAPSAPMTQENTTSLNSSLEGRRKQLMRELEELERNQARQVAVYEARQNEVLEARQDLKNARTTQDISRARQALYARISARDHARYQLEIM